MARKRMLDPNIWDSKDFSKLSLLAKLVFIGMFSLADDEGKGRAEASFLKSKIFPFDDGLRVADIDKTLEEIASHMSVTLYAQDGCDYYVLNNWHKWQKVEKPRPSLLPDFDGNTCKVIRGTFPEESAKRRGSVAPNKIEKNITEEKRKENNKKENSPAGSGSNCPSNIFTIWENINARPITGFEAERLQDLENIFSTQWIVDAMSEAGKAGKRNLRYVEGILNNWQSDGRNSKQSKKESFVEMAQRLQAEQEASNSESDRNGQSDGGIKTGLRQGNTRRTGGIKSVAESLSKLGLPNNK